MCLLPSSLFLSTDRVTISAEKSTRDFEGISRTYEDVFGWKGARVALFKERQGREGRKEGTEVECQCGFRACFCKGLELRAMQLGRVST